MTIGAILLYGIVSRRAGRITLRAYITIATYFFFIYGVYSADLLEDFGVGDHRGDQVDAGLVVIAMATSRTSIGASVS